MTRRSLIFGIVTAATFLASCSPLWFDTYWRRERYVLIAIDTLSEMSLAFVTADETAAGLVGPTIFSIGADERYIVIKRHPSKDGMGDDSDRSVTEILRRNAH